MSHHNTLSRQSTDKYKKNVSSTVPRLPQKVELEVKRISAKYRKRAKGKKSHRTRICIRTTHSNAFINEKVDTARLADYLKELSEALLALGVPDPQFSIQHRPVANSVSTVEIEGVIIDVDRPCESLNGAIVEAGVPMPNVAFHTNYGYKLIYIFDKRVPHKLAEKIAKWLTVACPGGDPKSWEIYQAQHLPICLKTKGDEQYEVRHDPVQLNAQPMAAEEFSFSNLPPRVARVATGQRRDLQQDERAQVEQFLHEKGTPAPHNEGVKSYSTCPNGKRHTGGSAFAVYRDAKGHITAHCYGNHDTGQPNHWFEHDLLRLAGAL